MPTKATLSITARPAQQIVSRQAESFCATPAQNLRTWWPTDIDMDLTSGSVFLRPKKTPANYPYGKSDYLFYPDDETAWVEGDGTLGQGDKSVGFSGNTTYPATTPWLAALDPANVTIGQNRGVVLSFIWYRPTGSTEPYFKFHPRVDPSKYVDQSGIRLYFATFMLTIDQQMRLNVLEYPYDNYDAFLADPAMSYTKTYTHPLNISADALGSKWHSIYVMPISAEDVHISSDILEGGGFLYRSAMDRDNIPLMSEGIAGIQSSVGGTGQVQITPLETASTGTLLSPKFSKVSSNTEYPTVKAFGWSPALIGTNNGYMDNQEIAVAGTGGISYSVYSVATDPATKAETLTLIDPNGGVPFQDFKVQLTMVPTSNVSPVLQDVVLDFGEDTTTVADPTVDITDDVLEMNGQACDDGTVRFNLKVKNKDGIYNSLAERIMTEIDVDVDGEDLAVLYTLNPSYQWFESPSQAALQLEWECGDGFEYLKRELCARMPAYDGQLLSTCLTEFMGRLGYDSSRLDIDVTDGTIGGLEIRLPKKRGKENFQFKPEDGTPACDFINKLKEWFGSTHTCRFSRDGKFQFKYVPVDSFGMEEPTISRIYYPDSRYKPDPDDHVVYRDAKVELMMDQFYNEIWVVGEDKRINKPLIAVHQDLPSQSDKNAANYVGRRLLMIVLTRCNTMAAVTGICNRLKAFYGRYGVRLTFNTRLDPKLQKDDFIQLYGTAATWRVVDIDYGMTLGAMASSNINSTTPVIRGQRVTAVQWPVSQ